MTMWHYQNGKEREAGEWKKLYQKADTRFDFVGISAPPPWVSALDLKAYGGKVRLCCRRIDPQFGYRKAYGLDPYRFCIVFVGQVVYVIQPWAESILGRTYIGRDVQLKEREWHSASSLHPYKGTSALPTNFNLPLVSAGLAMQTRS